MGGRRTPNDKCFHQRSLVNEHAFGNISLVTKLIKMPARGPQTKSKLAVGFRYPGLGTLTTNNPDVQAIGSWARYLGSGTQVEVDDE